MIFGKDNEFHGGFNATQAGDAGLDGPGAG